MAQYYKRVPVKTPLLRVLAKSEIHANQWAWVRPGEKSEFIPVVRYEDGPYLAVKL